MNQDFNKAAKHNLYLLSFLDTADRLNILLLEVRHLQQSIINSLHAPTLYLPLRYEEKFIFGGWEDLEKSTIIETTEYAILRYPSPKKAVSYWISCDKTRQDSSTIKETSFEPYW